jgi:hypothetical protein
MPESASEDRGPRKPADIVQASIDAYNASDMDATFQDFAEDIVVRDPDGAVQMEGLGQVRSRYAGWRAANPDISYEILSRITLGDWVVDEERVTGMAPPREGDELRAVIVYRVVDQRIREIRVLT